MEKKFNEAMKRVKIATGIKNQKELSEILRITAPAITEMKKTGKFPEKWAFTIEDKYNISAKWILEGVEPQKIKKKNDFFEEIKEWAEETGGGKNTSWFENQFARAFPDFVKWKHRKEEGLGNSEHYPLSKIA